MVCSYSPFHVNHARTFSACMSVTRSAPQRDPDRLSSGFASLIRERVQHRRFLDEDSNSGDTTVLSRYGAPLTTTLHARDSTRDPSRCFPKHFDRFANAMRIDGPLDSSKAHGGVAFPRRPQRRGAEDRRRSGSESHDAPSARVSPSSVCIESFGNDRPSACTALHPCNLHAFPCTGESCGRCDPDGPQRSPFGSLPAATSASVQRVSGREFSHRFRVPCYCCTTPYATRIFMTLRPTFFTARDKKK